MSASTVSARELLARLTEQYPRLRPILRSSRFLRNGEYLEDLATLIGVNDELAVHPPYGGG